MWLPTHYARLGKITGIVKAVIKGITSREAYAKEKLYPLTGGTLIVFPMLQMANAKSAHINSCSIVKKYAQW